MLDVDELTTVIEDFVGIFIRLPGVERLSFTTLSVLHTLGRTSPLRVAELTATEQVTQSAMTQLVTRLEVDGLVERRPDPADGRAVQVHLTDAGRQVLADRRADRVRRMTELVEHLDSAEGAAIAAALPALRGLVTGMRTT
jgi:DNA-binding MarR family transcriptional regulator